MPSGIRNKRGATVTKDDDDDYDYDLEGDDEEEECDIVTWILVVILILLVSYNVGVPTSDKIAHKIVIQRQYQAMSASMEDYQKTLGKQFEFLLSGMAGIVPSPYPPYSLPFIFICTLAFFYGISEYGRRS